MEHVVEILAVLFSPILAIVAGNWISDRREKRRRRQQLFQSLWLTRGDYGSFGRLSLEHVRALNMIDIEFARDDFELDPGGLTDAVMSAWQRYLSVLNRVLRDPNNATLPETQQWNRERDDALIDLLFEMSRSLGYSFDRDAVRNGAYAPRGYETNDLEGMVIRQFLREVLAGNRPIKIKMVKNNGPAISFGGRKTPSGMLGSGNPGT